MTVVRLRLVCLPDATEVALGVLRASEETEFVYHPGWLSLIIALLAGVVGMVAQPRAPRSRAPRAT